MLTTVATRPMQLVTREELKQALWPGASYGDFEHGLNADVIADAVCVAGCKEGHHIFYTQLDSAGANIMLVENYN